jgi:hypothetical protein
MNDFDVHDFYDKYDKFVNGEKLNFKSKKQKSKGKVYSSKHIRISQSKIKK